MLKVFRDNLKYLSWVLWLVVALFIFFIYADFGTAGRRGGGRVSDNAAAHVGNQQVTMEEYERHYKRLEGLYRQIYGDQFTPEAARQMGLPLQALNQAVSQKIFLAEAKSMGLTATDEEVRDRVLQEPAFKDEQGHFVGEDRYSEILRGSRYPSPAAFEAELREEILIKKLMDILEANVYVSDQEVEKSYRDQVEKARIRYIQLPRARFSLAATEVADAEVKDYFEKHKPEYRLPEQREAAYLLVDPSQLAASAAAASIDEKALRDYYDQHQQEFTRPEQVHARHIIASTQGKDDAAAQAKIAAAKARLAKGEGFAIVAQELSDEPAAKTSGGDLGYFGRGQMDKQFEDAAFGAPVGTVIGPIKSRFGYHLIEVLDKRAAGAQPFEEARETIRQRLSIEQTSQAAEARAKVLAKRLAEDKPKSADALKAMVNPPEGVSFGETGPFGKQEPIKDLGYAPAFANAAFALQKGGVSEVVQTPRGWTVLYLKDIKAPRIPELKDVEPRVRAALARQKQQDQALEQLRQAKASGKTLDQISAELGLEIKESSEFGAEGAIPGIGANPELAKAALALNTGQMGGPVTDAQGALLFEVKERKSWDPIQFAAAREQTRDAVRREKLNSLESALLEQRRREMDVTFNPKLLEEFGINAQGQPVQPGQPAGPAS
jgi:peptidyl-prolyl cis-trans isomerase D